MCWLLVSGLITLCCFAGCFQCGEKNRSKLDITAAHVLQRFTLLGKDIYLIILNSLACVDRWLSFIWYDPVIPSDQI